MAKKREDVVAQVKALYAKAESTSGSTEAEIEASLRVAAKLVETWMISEKEIEAIVIDDDHRYYQNVFGDIPDKGMHDAWMFFTTQLSEMLGVFSSYGIKTNDLMVYGKRDLIAVFDEVLGRVIQDMARIADDSPWVVKGLMMGVAANIIKMRTMTKSFGNDLVICEINEAKHRLETVTGHKMVEMPMNAPKVQSVEEIMGLMRADEVSILNKVN